jgi:hypothetical protein
VRIKVPDGEWRTVSSNDGAVDEGGATPYLLQELPPGTRALGMEVRVRTSGTAEVAYVNAIGPAVASAPAPGRLSAG